MSKAETTQSVASPPEFSVIITCYYEEASIDEFHARLTAAMEGTGRSFEIIFVNDGSTDGTFEKLKAIHARDTRVSTVADLFRNTGQVCAMSCGVALAQGRSFIFMDSDLQLDPEELPRLIGAFDEGQDIVSGYRAERQDSLLRTMPSRLANVIMRRVARHPLRDFGCTFKVYRGELVRAFGFGPHKPWQTAYVFAQAGRVKEIPVSHHPRRHGRSGWSMLRLSAFLIDHLVGVSYRPFQLLSALCFVAAFLLLARIAIAWAVPFSVLPAVTPGLILNAVALHLLVSLAVLSAIGEYVIRSFVALRRDPIYVIRELIRRDAP